MELLWEDLRANASDLSYPEWHSKVIREREEMVEKGKFAYSDWQDEKKDIHNRIT